MDLLLFGCLFAIFRGLLIIFDEDILLRFSIYYYVMVSEDGS